MTELEKRTQAFEMRCYRSKNHVTNEEVRRKIQAVIGKYHELLTLVNKRKGPISRSSGLAKTILQCKEKEEKADRKRGEKIILICGVPTTSQGNGMDCTRYMAPRS